ncbi:uncharacterized protein LOC110715912 [Chenopodium quinoa]|uniref:uncharacterized protein LOC110715912 n=1 Tax=Chenopodium quinoa TaxID=63459 RepID=UPI000B772D24|nr:uncharacterized protein LOC110715912 [Chenopodium quinoa]
MGLVGEFEEACKLNSPVVPSQNLGSVWKAPDAGAYKLNTDANFSVQQLLGVGGVLRDADGSVLMAYCSTLRGSYGVDLGEAIAMRQSLGIALEVGFRNFMLETDNIKLFHHMKKGIIIPNDFGNVIRDILRLVSQCFSCSFSFVKRFGNGVAHGLANLSSNFSEYRAWLEEYPSEIHGEVCNDLDLLMNE